jgi:hypothetical protein
VNTVKKDFLAAENVTTFLQRKPRAAQRDVQHIYLYRAAFRLALCAGIREADEKRLGALYQMAA